MNIKLFKVIILMIFTISLSSFASDELKLAGVSVIPHIQSKEMKYRQESNFSLGARIQIYLQNTSPEMIQLNKDTNIHLRNISPQELITSDQWSWHDFPAAYPEHPLELHPGALTVWSWNGNYAEWGLGTNAQLSINDYLKTEIEIKQPLVYLSSITFISDDENVFPNTIVFYIANDSDHEISIESCRLWLPQSNNSWRSLYPQSWNNEFSTLSEDKTISAHDKGGAIVKTTQLPLTYSALEVRIKNQQGVETTIWGYLRIKREAFDISGGWISSDINGKNSLTIEPYLQTLKRMHINTGHISDVAGYTDHSELYNQYPIKYFNKLDNFARFDTIEMLPRIHAVEFLGEPQYGGGKPVLPMEVWKSLFPYQSTQLPTSITHSEERIWRFYSGLSDYPHFDAYRVTAPSADNWRMYDRWGDERIRWGAPLETIGVMTHSLRQLNRPMPIAYWSQGAHDGWGSYGGRERTSPTPDELKAQAYQALSARITSLYWFNLSLESLVKFRDLIQPITEINREIMLLEHFYLFGDVYHTKRIIEDHSPKWDLSVLVAPQGALLFALDLNYKINYEKKEFQFNETTNAVLEFPLPSYLMQPKEVLRVSSQRVDPISFQSTKNSIQIQTTFTPFNLFIATQDLNLKKDLANALQSLIEFENLIEFDPANNQNDYEILTEFINNK